MTAINKEKMIGMVVCVFMLGILSIANAQEKITDKTLMSLDSEVKRYLDKGDINNAGTKILDAYEKAAKDKNSLSPAATKELSNTLLKMGEAVHKKRKKGSNLRIAFDKYLKELNGDLTPSH